MYTERIWLDAINTATGHQVLQTKFKILEEQNQQLLEKLEKMKDEDESNVGVDSDNKQTNVTHKAQTTNSDIASQFEDLKKKLESDMTGQHDYSLAESCTILSKIKKLETEAKKQKEKEIGDIIKYFDNISKQCNEYWNKLGGNATINSFEQKWTQWTIDETVQWFDFVLKNSDNNDYEIGYDSSGSEDSENSEDNDEKKVDLDDNDIGYQSIISKLQLMNFRAKTNLPYLGKAFHFQQFGFKNKLHCKILCQQTKKLIAKYPKKAKVTKTKNKKQGGYDASKIKNLDNSNVEGFVPETNKT